MLAARCLGPHHDAWQEVDSCYIVRRFGEIEVISKLLRLVGILHLLDDLRCDDSSTLVSCADGIEVLAGSRKQSQQ